MKRFIKDLLYVPKYEKISDKTFNTRMILSVISMIISVVLLCSMTLAFFKLDIATGNTTVKSAVFTVEIDGYESITGGEEEYLVLPAGKLIFYSNGVKGYCIIEDSEGEKTCLFDDTVTEMQLYFQNEGEVKISDCWGESYSGAVLSDGDTIIPFAIKTVDELEKQEVLSEKSNAPSTYSDDDNDIADKADEETVSQEEIIVDDKSVTENKDTLKDEVITENEDTTDNDIITENETKATFEDFKFERENDLQDSVTEKNEVFERNETVAENVTVE